MIIRYRKYIILFFLLLIPLSIYQLTKLKFSFNFEDFFPQGDPDLAFFQEFIDDFETDDNFLLVAVKNDSTIFDQSFLEKFHQLTIASKKLPYVDRAQSLTSIEIPIKTPFGYSTLPLIHIDKPERYESDKKNILSDVRFKNTLINEDADALVLNLQTHGFLTLPQSDTLMRSLDKLLTSYDFDETHKLGRAYFQKEMVEMQKREILISSFISILLVSIVMILIYRKWITVFIALASITLSLLYFLGLLSFLGKEMNLMSALYPVLMLIVGTSDVIHIMSCYLDELRAGKNKSEAMSTTIKQIGIATLLTSLTTAIGFFTLVTSIILPIRQFGLNAAIGVVLAYVVVILLTTSVLTLFSKEQLLKTQQRGSAFWDGLLEKWYHFTLHRGKLILLVSSICIGLCIYGVMRISTNYTIEKNLPRDAAVTNDFKYFESAFSGFRPLEFAVTVVDSNYRADDYEVLKEVSKVEDYLSDHPIVNSTVGLTTLYKSIEKANKRNRPEAYRFPEDKRSFTQAKKLMSRMNKSDINSFLNKDRSKTRLSSRIKDAGADVIKAEGIQMDNWINQNVDTSIIDIKRTGTGIIIDKNAEFIKRDLFQGLFIALLLVSILMALLFRSVKMLIIALIPNIIPILFAGALMGYLGIDLEAGVSIIFAVVFGIAVDDTIHFLSKYKLMRASGASLEEALHKTFTVTGKAITFTTITLFFGFLVMLFSSHPPSYTVGFLISITLVGAWLCDLFLLPIIIRRVMD